MTIDESLEQLGLSPREMRVYRECLDLGPTSIMPLVKRTGIARSSLSYVLEKLKQLGLIEIVLKNSRKLYFPNSPRSVLNLLKKELKKQEAKVEAFETTLPEFNQLFKSSPFQPTLRLFRGTEIRDCYSLFLEGAENEIWNVGETEKIFEVLGVRFWNNWSNERAHRKIRARAIRVGSEDLKSLSDTPSFLRTVKFAPAGFTSPAHIVICGDNVAIITAAKESFCVLISSKDYAQTMKSWFKELWAVSSDGEIGR